VDVQLAGVGPGLAARPGLPCTYAPAFGLRPPDRLGEVARFVEDMHHSVAIALAAIWPLNFWRIDPMGPADYEWFENHYPGWTARYGGLWDAYRAMSDPSSGCAGWWERFDGMNLADVILALRLQARRVQHVSC
jgi:hypothetical protein